jgi:hypothetical protein
MWLMWPLRLLLVALLVAVVIGDASALPPDLTRYLIEL